MTTLLVHHAAHRGGHHHPAGSLEGLRYCLEAGARVVEVDIVPLADGDFAMLHDRRWEPATDGWGEVSTTPLRQARRFRYTDEADHRVITDEPVGLLSQALELLDGYPQLMELQLDLKPHFPPDEAILRRLLRQVEPVRDRVRVSSVADWVLRRLRRLDAELPLGFDPLLYLDVGPADGEWPPFRVNAYGYRDDHPLGLWRWGRTADYLEARAETLFVQSPPGALWYIRGQLLARALDDGFDWIDYLHRRQVEVDAWTLDAGDGGQVALARRLVVAGVDRITTNDAPRLAEVLGEEVVV